MMALALIGVTAASVAAAPGGTGSGPQANAQIVGNLTAIICDNLDINNDGTVDATEAVTLAVDIDNDGNVDAADQSIVITNCTALLAPVVPPTGDLTAVICGVLDLNDDGAVDAGEAVALALDLDRDGDIDVADQNIAIANCTALLAPVLPPTGPISTIICNLLDINDDGTVTAIEAQSLATDLDGDGDIDVADQNIALLNCPTLLAPDPGPGVPTDPGGPGVTPTPGGAPITGEPGSIVVSKFVCTQIEEPTAAISDPIGVSGGEDDDENELGCSPDTASFEIYLNNDFSAEPFASFEAGVETVNGIPENAGGVPHLLLEVDTNVFFSFFVESGGVTTISVLNPGDDGDATPIADDDGGDKDDDGGDGGDKDDDGGASDDGASSDDDGGTGDDGASSDDGSTSGGGVSALPSTGQGAESGTSGSAIVLLFGAMSLVALAAGFAWRQRRTV